MTDATEAWPFVVSRNPELDWRPVIAPPFLIEARADYLLVHETAGGGASDRPQLRRVDSGLGRLTLAYRRRDAWTALLGDSSNLAGEQQLHDRFGRPIHLIEGLVVRGDRDIPRSQVGPLLDAVRVQAAAAFPSFWQLADESIPPLPSAPLIVPTQPRGRLPMDLLVAGAMGALALLWLRGRQGGDTGGDEPTRGSREAAASSDRSS